MEVHLLLLSVIVINIMTPQLQMKVSYQVHAIVFQLVGVQEFGKAIPKTPQILLKYYNKYYLYLEYHLLQKVEIWDSIEFKKIQLKMELMSILL